jgi:hypothetical protein
MDNKTQLQELISEIVKTILEFQPTPSSRVTTSALLSLARSIMQEEGIPSFEIVENTGDNKLTVCQLALNEIDLKNMPQIGSEWMDEAASAAYVVVNVTNVMGPVNMVENPIQIVFKDMDSNVWSLPLSEWMLRMTPLQA